MCAIQSHLVSLGLASYDTSPVAVDQKLTENILTENILTENILTENLDSTASSDRFKDPFDEWDPLSEDFTSIRNNPHFRQDNVEMVNEGFATEAARNEKICKFYSANGRCSRGKDCRFIHVQASIGKFFFQLGTNINYFATYQCF